MIKDLHGIPTPNIENINKNVKVSFTRRQYDYLNRIYGESTGSAATTEAELRLNQGRRQVVLHIGSLVDG